MDKPADCITVHGTEYCQRFAQDVTSWPDAFVIVGIFICLALVIIFSIRS